MGRFFTEKEMKERGFSKKDILKRLNDQKKVNEYLKEITEADITPVNNSKSTTFEQD